MKTCQNDSETFSSFFRKPVGMTGGHFPPFCENMSEWQSDIILLFLKTCQNDSWTFSSFFGKPVRMKGGHFPPFCEKMSDHYTDKFS